MASEKQNKRRKNESLSFFIKLILVALSAFLAGVCYRPSVGILAMTPLAFIFCVASAFIGIDAKIKYVCFGVTVFWLNTVEQTNMKSVLIYTALCLLVCVASEYGKKLSKKNKSRGIALITASFVIAGSLSILFVGNPFSANNAKKEILEYAEQEYPKSDEFFGDFVFSDVYYNFDTKTYVIDAKSSKFPTEGATLSFNNGVIRDGFISIVEEKASEPFVLEFTEILRHSFPSDTFKVEFDGFAFLPSENLFKAGNDGLYGNINFEITLYGIQSIPEFFDRIDRYYEAVCESGVNYSSIVFKTENSSRNGIWFARSVTLDCNFKKEFAKYKLELVPTGTSRLFNGFFNSFTHIN